MTVVPSPPSRRPSTLTVATVLLCVIDVVLAPGFLLMASFGADAPSPTPALTWGVRALAAAAAAALACGVFGFVAGLLGARQRVVEIVAAAPVVAAMVTTAVLLIGVLQ